MRKFRMNKINREEPLDHKKLRVTNPQYFGIPLGEVIIQYSHEIVVVSRLKHSGEVSVFSPKVRHQSFKDRDVLMVVGKEADLQDFIKKV
jgi:putative transport protein